MAWFAVCVVWLISSVMFVGVLFWLFLLVLFLLGLLGVRASRWFWCMMFVC